MCREKRGREGWKAILLTISLVIGFKVILNHFGSIGFVLGNFGSLLGCYGSFWAVMDSFGLLWTILA